MWTRSQLKENAKGYLKSIYLMAFAVSLIMALIGSNGPDVKYNLWDRTEKIYKNEEIAQDQTWFDVRMNKTVLGWFVDKDAFREKMDYNDLTETELSRILYVTSALLGTLIIIFVIGFLLSIFIFNPLILGGKRFFLNAAKDRSESFSDMGFAFSAAHYWNVVLTLFLKNLFIFLWTLLLIIPGIIKKYAYSMVSYILSENPEMPYNEALERSNDMTRGHKWDMFVLDLSFLGWYILSSLLLGIGFYFVHPYYNATHAELYLALKEKNSLSIDYDSYQE